MLALLLLAAQCHLNHTGDGATLPDPACSPGAVMESCTLEQMQVHGYSATVRHTSAKLKRSIYDEYGVKNVRGANEVDHRVPLAVCGADVAANLWPQPYQGPWNAHQKDRLENAIIELVRSGALTLKQGQAVFLGDWRDGYRKYVNEDDPAALDDAVKARKADQ